MKNSFVATIVVTLAVLGWTAQANAESYRSKRDSAGWTHYYDSKGSQRCISKKNAAGDTKTYCN